MNEIKIEKNDYYLIAVREDRSWGHGVKVSIYDYDNMLIGKLYFACHPEFDDYNIYQKYETDELVKIASNRIAEEMALGEYQQAWDVGATLFLRFNQPNEKLPKTSA